MRKVLNAKLEISSQYAAQKSARSRGGFQGFVKVIPTPAKAGEEVVPGFRAFAALV